MNDKEKFQRICKDIKSLKIQGAESVAIAGLEAYELFQSDSSIKKLLSLRATEPALRNALSYAKKFSVEDALRHFRESEERAKKFLLEVVKNDSVIFTHCHSSSVVEGLLYARRHGKKFSVVNTETRPLFQGRKTATELAKAGIQVVTMIDSAAGVEIKKASSMIIGCDAILKDGSVINKIGSGMFAQVAYDLKKPVYVVTDSWKFSSKKVQIEERNFDEIWKSSIKNLKVRNPAFERVDSKFITSIISDMGILKPKEFSEKFKESYPALF